MASHQLFILFSVLLLSSCLAFITVSAEEHPVEKRAHVVVEGVVYCQSCQRHGTWSLGGGAKPMASAKVSVICKDHKDRVNFYKVFATNEDGYFYGELDGFKMGHYILDHPLHACVVRLVASPNMSCNYPTNVNYGINGASLRYENKVLFGSDYEAVVYSAGPLAYRPSSC
ncbi:hypothetical protein ACHQM5_007568 [Ranunculus cassubicifolius]